MKPRVAVVCAFNPGNVGMHSVDAAARHVFADHGVEYVLVNFQRKPWRPDRNFRLVRDVRDLAQFSHVLFWGDFQNNPVYGERDFASREVKYGYAANCGQGFASWRDYHLNLASRLPPSTIIASLGNCFLGTIGALRTADLKMSFEAFLSQSAVIMPRDDRSVAELRSIAPERTKEKIVPGLDLAFLQPSLPLAVRTVAPGFGYFFGRSKATHVVPCIEFLSRSLRLDPIKIPWLTGSRRVLCAFTHATALRRFKSCRFVVTDVYHLAVNAMNAGVPAICLSRANCQTKSSVDDAKKYALLEQLHAEALHLTIPEDGSLLALKDRIVETYRSLEHDPARLDEVEQRLGEGRARSRNIISTLLGS